MGRSVTTVSETFLSNATGIDRQQIYGALIAAGITPLETVERKTGVFRLWPKRAALAALRRSDPNVIREHRDATAHARARILQIKAGLADGSLVTLEKNYADVDRLLMLFRHAIRHFHSRHCNDFASAAGLPDAERRAVIAKAIAPTFDTLLNQLPRSH